MQSKNQVVNIRYKSVQSNCSADRVRKRDRHPTLLLPPELLTYSLLLQCVQSKNGVDLVEVSSFYKSEKMSDQTVWPIKIKTVTLFYVNGHLVFKLLS